MSTKEETKATQAAVKKAIQNAVESMTGFDEIAVKQKFGAPLDSLLQQDRLQGLRAIVFVEIRREGKKDDEAFHRTQELSIKEVNARFIKPDDGLADFDEKPSTTTP